MRRLFRRKSVRMLFAIVSFTAIPGFGILATASPAPASTDLVTTICNNSGHMGCIGAPSLTSGSPVELTTSGRVITEQQVIPDVVKLSINAANNMCVDLATNTLGLVLRPCASAQDWTRTKTVKNGVTSFMYSDADGNVITSDNVIGDQLSRNNPGCTPNCFQRWAH